MTLTRFGQVNTGNQEVARLIIAHNVAVDAVEQEHDRGGRYDVLRAYAEKFAGAYKVIHDAIAAAERTEGVQSAEPLHG